MREIKFRARIKATNEILEVVVINWDIEEVICVKNREPVYHKFREIDLLEFTGQKDKKNKEIWEGDIVKIKRIGNLTDLIGLIIYEPAKFLFKHLNLDGATYIPAVFEDSEEVEIIGNIYQNPELLS